MPEVWLWLLPLLFVIAMLYSSVGQGGASAYVAALTLAGVQTMAIRPGALLLNLIVAGMAGIQFARAGRIPWRTLAMLVAFSAPFAVIGGSIDLPRGIYTKVVGLLLLWTAVKIFWRNNSPESVTRVPAAKWKVYLASCGIGLIAGLTGLGGGIFLAPLLIFAGWGSMHETLGLCSGFIVINSAAALLGQLGTSHAMPPDIGMYGLMAACGGFVGSMYGSRFKREALQKILGFVLALAAVKLLLD